MLPDCDTVGGIWALIVFNECKDHNLDPEWMKWELFSNWFLTFFFLLFHHSDIKEWLSLLLLHVTFLVLIPKRGCNCGTQNPQGIFHHLLRLRNWSQSRNQTFGSQRKPLKRLLLVHLGWHWTFACNGGQITLNVSAVDLQGSPFWQELFPHWSCDMSGQCCLFPPWGR